MEQAQKMRKCPYCKEEILQEAVKCKHCQSMVAPDTPTHGGTCPYCKEQIQPDAIKCKHCLAYLLPAFPLSPLKLWGIGTSPGPYVSGTCLDMFEPTPVSFRKMLPFRRTRWRSSWPDLVAGIRCWDLMSQRDAILVALDDPNTSNDDRKHLENQLINVLRDINAYC